jgi:signal transduction histidine kinase
MPSTDDELELRREALGAFAHDLRTPLTSIRLLLDLATDRETGEVRLDAELAPMLVQSVADLEALADALHEASRVERGKLKLSRGPGNLAACLRAARKALDPRVQIAGEVDASLVGPWDPERLAAALAGLAEATNRIGCGDGVVRLRLQPGGHGVRLGLTSGEPGGEPGRIAADAGFGFFQARTLLVAMGAEVEWSRADQYFSVTLTLPGD